MTSILGIDIGTSGAIALLEADGSLVSIDDMPLLRDGPKKRASINSPLLADCIFRSHATQAFVEHVGPRRRRCWRLCIRESAGRDRRHSRRNPGDIHHAASLEKDCRRSLRREGRGAIRGDQAMARASKPFLS
jgi:hypothetical protein